MALTFMKVYYFGHIIGVIREGGMARNHAFQSYFQAKGYRIKNLYNSIYIIRAIRLISTILKFALYKKRTFFLHQGSLFVMFPTKIFSISIIRKIIIKLLNFTSSRNELIIEVN